MILFETGLLALVTIPHRNVCFVYTWRCPYQLAIGTLRVLSIQHVVNNVVSKLTCPSVGVNTILHDNHVQAR